MANQKFWEVQKNPVLKEWNAETCSNLKAQCMLRPFRIDTDTAKKVFLT